jgi:baculoviral IAP repeat-containing protein 6 (apollon)
MRPLQYDEYDLLSSTQHHYYSRAVSDGIGGTTKLRRLIAELPSLSNNLPLHVSSSVFLRVDHERSDILAAMITGPLGTPYCGGCFQFDIFLPSSYPSTPPLVNLQTTGHGSVRFNPVCN